MFTSSRTILLQNMIVSNLNALDSYQRSVESGLIPDDYRYFDRLLRKIEFYERLLKGGNT